MAEINEVQSLGRDFFNGDLYRVVTRAESGFGRHLERKLFVQTGCRQETGLLEYPARYDRLELAVSRPQSVDTQQCKDRMSEDHEMRITHVCLHRLGHRRGGVYNSLKPSARPFADFETKMPNWMGSVQQSMSG